MKLLKFCLLLFLLPLWLMGCEEQSTEPGTQKPISGAAANAPEAVASTADDAPDAREFLQQAVNLQTEFASRAGLLADARMLVGGGEEVTAENDILHEGDDTENDAEDGLTRIEGKIEPGSTLSELLEDAGADNIQHYIKAIAKVFPLHSFQAGKPYVVCTDNGQVCRFEYEIDDQQMLVAEGNKAPKARLEKIKYDTKLAVCSGTIKDSLFNAITDAGETPQLALKLAGLFGSEINFLRHIREGDSFSILVEKRFRDGDYKGYGRILGATFTNQGKTYEGWLFPDGYGNFNYYTAKGENLRKTLLTAPLAVTRMTSKFTHARWHPILGGMRPHLGVDYGAPTGTPVKAVGSGIVTQKGPAGGYGNQIIIKHDSGMESMYGHLSGFARGLREGKSVKQGETIGFVGSTGLSTGPHLDFRLRQNGKFIDPAKAINPRGAPLDDSLMAKFKKTVALSREYLKGRDLPATYRLDSIVPSQVSLPKPKISPAESWPAMDWRTRARLQLTRSKLMKYRAGRVFRPAEFGARSGHRGYGARSGPDRGRLRIDNAKHRRSAKRR